MKTPFSLDSVIATFVPLWLLKSSTSGNLIPIEFNFFLRSCIFQFVAWIESVKDARGLERARVFALSFYANEVMHFPFNYARYSGHARAGFLA